MDSENAMKHSVTIHGCNTGSFTGVKKVVAFNPEKVVLDTYKGKLEIDGNNLYIERFDTDRQILDMTGEILGLKYSETKSISEKGTGFLTRLFR